METILIPIFLILASAMAAYGYYLISLEEIEQFDQKKHRKTSYRTNEEFVESEPGDPLKL